MYSGFLRPTPPVAHPVNMWRCFYIDDGGPFHSCIYCTKESAHVLSRTRAMQCVTAAILSWPDRSKCATGAAELAHHLNFSSGSNLARKPNSFLDPCLSRHQYGRSVWKGSQRKRNANHGRPPYEGNTWHEQSTCHTSEMTTQKKFLHWQYTCRNGPKQICHPCHCCSLNPH